MFDMRFIPSVVRTGLMLALPALLAACSAAQDCNGNEYLSYHQEEVVVMTPGCSGDAMRLATPADIARLTPPL